MKLSRRQFLASIIAIGVTIALPVPPAQAPPAQIDQARDKLKQDPWYFKVDEHGLIDEPGQDEPKIRSDLYYVAVVWITTVDDLIREVDQYDELRGHFVGLATDAKNEVQDQLDGHAPLAVAQRLRLKELEKVLEDPDNGWQEWVRMEGSGSLDRFKREIENWLAEGVDHSQMASWPNGWNGLGRAKSFFEDVDGGTLDAVGIVLMEGEIPWSTSSVALLRNHIGNANATAAKFGLSFRFRAEEA